MADRRAVGAVLLLFAALALVVVTRLNGPDVRGNALPAPQLPVPPIGSCFDVTDESPVETGCNTIHNAEAVATWAAQDTSEPTPDQLCSDTYNYMGMPPDTADGWSPPAIPVHRRIIAVGGLVGCAPRDALPLSVRSGIRRSPRGGVGPADIGPPRQLGGPLIEVMVEPIPPRDLGIFHVMPARQKFLDLMNEGE